MTSVVGPDRYIPTEREGKLEPNYYCRAWNPRRTKYCKARAGHGTAHVGVGRCRMHDGRAEELLTHGQDRRYSVKSERIQELIALHEDRPDPLDILPELALARAYLTDLVDRGTEINEALLAWYVARCNGGEDAPPRVALIDIGDVAHLISEVTKIAERYVVMQGRNAITFDQLRRFLFAAERKIEGRIRDAIADPSVVDRTVKFINRDLRGIRP